MRGSMFDPYRKEITEWCEQGMTSREILENLGGGFMKASLNEYIRRWGLREPRHYPGCESRNKCDECEYCQEFRNWKGSFDKSNRICTKTWQVISYGVIYCPTWCEKGGANG